MISANQLKLSRLYWFQAVGYSHPYNFNIAPVRINKISHSKPITEFYHE